VTKREKKALREARLALLAMTAAYAQLMAVNDDPAPTVVTMEDLGMRRPAA
jgi:hypothetical protein